jgi:hypothetical protein
MYSTLWSLLACSSFREDSLPSARIFGYQKQSATARSQYALFEMTRRHAQDKLSSRADEQAINFNDFWEIQKYLFYIF